MEWLAKGITVAVKRNGTECVDTAAIDNERSLYEKLMANPHDHVLPVYGICTDAPDGKVRLVMKLCEKGSLDALLRAHAVPEVGVLCFSGGFFALFSIPPASAWGFLADLPWLSCGYRGTHMAMLGAGVWPVPD